AREVEYQWNECGVKVAIVTDSIFAQKLNPIRDRLPVRDYIIASIPEYLRFPLNLLAPIKLRRMKPPMIAKVRPGPGIHFFRDLVRHAGPPVPAVPLRGDQPAVLLYTGGTTGV